MDQEEQQQEPWFIRLGFYWIFTIGAALGIAFIGLVAFIFHWQPGLWAGLGITLLFGIAANIAAIGWICVTSLPALRGEASPHLARYSREHYFPVPVPLGKFLDDPEAVIAPNLHPDACDRLAAWLKKFAARHGDDSVWVLPLPDGPFADRVVLAVTGLSAGEFAALKKFDLDTIEEYPDETRSKHFPQIEPSRKLVELAWD